MTMDKNGDPTSQDLCDVQLDYIYDIRNESLEKMKVGSFTGEFGALPDDGDGHLLLACNLYSLGADSRSWTYWQYKPFGDFTTVFVG